MMNSSQMIRVVTVGVLVALGACSDRSAERATVKVDATEKPSELVSSGRPEAPLIDPQKKSVAVLIAPTESQAVEQRQASLLADTDRREATMHNLMKGYSENLGSPVQKARYEKQIEQEMTEYKQRILELNRLQRVANVPERRDVPAE